LLSGNNLYEDLPRITYRSGSDSRVNYDYKIKTITYYITKIKSEAGPPPCN
jgi:hypothetical protein